MISLRINTAMPYDVIVGAGILKNLGALVAEVHPICKAMIITDCNVAPLYLSAATASLGDSGFDVRSCIFQSGEEHKTLNTFSYLMSAAAANKMSRTDIIIALGGGIVGDVAGFVASAYMRGISYVQVPTTLLAAIDSSVGGKTGVNLKEGKNLVGAFHQPIRVVCDTDTFETLSSNYFLDGVGEAAKYALLDGQTIYSLLLSSNIKDNLEQIICECVKIKKEIVQQDTKECSVRKLLNLGHTVGHAIEKLSNYKVSHGMAVAKGLAYISKVSLKNDWLSQDSYCGILALLEHLQLNYSCDYTKEQLISYITMDKKVDGDSVDLIIPLRIGMAEIKRVKLNELNNIL